MAIELITGRAGEPHVDSADVGALNAALFGAGAYVLEGVEAELVDANSVLVTAGEMMCEGRHIRITGDGETLTIENGLSSYKRHDIAAVHYLRDEDGIETVTLEVIKGTNSSTSPQDPPMPRNGKTLDGASEAYWPIYRIVIDGLTPQTPVFIAQRQALYQLGLGTEIPAGADLNDYKTPGKYYIPYNTMAGNLANRPETTHQSATLIVYTATDNGAIIQELHGNGSYLYWQRLWSASSAKWNDWTCFGGIDSIVAEGTTNEWKWVKFANGMFYAHKTQNNDGTAVSTASGSIYYSSDIAVSLPFQNVGTLDIAGVVFGFTGFVGIVSSTATSFSFRYGSGQSGTKSICRAKFAIFGNWK